jgi:plasmid stabilization system protein ParE
MNRKVQLSRRATRDIEEAYLYIRHDAPERAKLWRERLQQAIRSLKAFPERHSVLFDAATAGRDVRQMTFGVYLVLYSVETDRIDVLTVRHGARQPIEPSDVRESE